MNAPMQHRSAPTVGMPYPPPPPGLRWPPAPPPPPAPGKRRFRLLVVIAVSVLLAVAGGVAAAVLLTPDEPGDIVTESVGDLRGWAGVTYRGTVVDTDGPVDVDVTVTPEGSRAR